MIKSKMSQSGFALLVTLIVIGAVTAIGLSLLELTTKQVRLAYVSHESERAFHATNAGAECARYWRRLESDAFEAGTSGVSAECFGDTPSFSHEDAVSATAIAIDSGSGDAHRYTTRFAWDSADRCTVVDMLVVVVPVTESAPFVLDNVDAVYPGYTGAGGELECGIGGRCTLIRVSGYGLPFTSADPCNDSTLTTLGTIQRELLLQF